MGQFIQSLKDLAPEKRWSGLQNVKSSGGHRTEHGGTAWSSKPNLAQPQDGAPVSADANRITSIGARLQMTALGALALGEPEDARLTGTTRSLMRRMIGLNIAKPAPRRKIAVSSAKKIRSASSLAMVERVA